MFFSWTATFVQSILLVKDVFSLEYVILLLCLAFIPAIIANSKGRNFWLWYLYGVLIFIVALVHALCLSKSPQIKEQELKNNGYKECPFCREMVKEGAIVCPHCRRDLPIDTPSIENKEQQ